MTDEMEDAVKIQESTRWAVGVIWFKVLLTFCLSFNLRTSEQYGPL